MKLEQLHALARAAGRYAEPWFVDAYGRVRNSQKETITSVDNLEIGNFICQMKAVLLPLINYYILNQRSKKDLGPT